MLKIENVVLPSVEQWFAVIRGMRNPKNSWDKSDSFKTLIENLQTENTADFEFFMGENDYGLAKRLATGGPVHGKFKRMIPVYLDITAPLYWWKEFDTYKVGTVANSCSTMHKITDKEFTLEDFSCEHIFNDLNESHLQNLDKPEAVNYKACFDVFVELLNNAREWYLKTNDKKYWWQIIQFLPSSYNQKRTVMLNYEVLSNIYQYRKDHKLDEWHVLCDWIETLPYSELITGNYPDGYSY